MAAEDKTNKEREPQPGSKQLLNDVFRKSLGMTGAGRVVMTSGAAQLPEEIRNRVLLAVRNFDNFDDGDDQILMGNTILVSLGLTTNRRFIGKSITTMQILSTAETSTGYSQFY